MRLILNCILKLLCAPVVAVLAIVVWFAAFLLELSAIVFGLAGTLLGILGVLVMLAGSVKNGCIVLVIAFLVSPFGLPNAESATRGERGVAAGAASKAAVCHKR